MDMQKFENALNTFVGDAQKLINDHYKKNFASLTPSLLTIKPGHRYDKIVITSDGGKGQASVYCFIEKSNGDVLKAATWRAPAKHARGNIFNADHGMSGITVWGARYL